MVEGSCLCGGIEYEVELVPEKVFNCHCSFCRKAHGAAFVTLAMAKGDTLNIKKGDSLLTEHLNALGGYRAFCSVCGTRLMNYAPDKSMYLSIALSTVDSEISFEPVAHCNVESKASWHQPYTGIPCFPGFPDGVLE